jgi:glycosyltransferase involved in cell wall biosynthesis
MISVITPAYNSEAFIQQAVESVLSQDFQQWEMIVVDDGSSDRTKEIVREFVARDSRIRLIENQHGGVSTARNTGIELAKYEWIALLDADDVFLPGKLQMQFEAASRDPEVVLWGTYAYNIGESGRVYDMAQDGPTSRKAFELLRKNGSVVMLKNSSTLFRRELALSLGGFDSRYDSSEDTELWNRMAEHGPVIVIPKPLILYRFHPQSLSVRKMEFQYICVQFIQARNLKRLAHQDLSLDEFMKTWNRRGMVRKCVDQSRILSNAYWRSAGIMFSNGMPAKGGYWLMRAFASNPVMISSRIIRKLWIKLHG